MLWLHVQALKSYSHIVGGSFLGGKAAWALSVVKVTSLLAKARFSFESELGQKWRYGVFKGMHRLNYSQVKIIQYLKG